MSAAVSPKALPTVAVVARHSYECSEAQLLHSYECSSEIRRKEMIHFEHVADLAATRCLSYVGNGAENYFSSMQAYPDIHTAFTMILWLVNDLVPSQE